MSRRRPPDPRDVPGLGGPGELSLGAAPHHRRDVDEVPERLERLVAPGMRGQDQRVQSLHDRLQGDQKPAPRRIGEGGHLSEEGWCAHILHPFIRIKGYTIWRRKSIAQLSVCP